MKAILKLMVILSIMVGSSAAQADIIHWKFDAQFDDGTCISGNFSVDNARHSFGPFEVTTQQKGNFSAHQFYTDDVFLYRPDGIVLRAPIVSPNDLLDFVFLRFFQPLYLLGYDQIVIGDASDSLSNPIDFATFDIRSAQSVAYISEHRPDSAIPEPSSIAIFGFGLIALAALSRRQTPPK
jgi:hypothetical protein